MSRRVTKVALTGQQRSAKKMLDQIVKFLQTEDIESIKLWAILTALRGPDSGNNELKKETTARLRYAIGLRTYKNVFPGHFTTSSKPLYTYGKPLENGGWHFTCHFDDAVRVIQQMKEDGLKEANKEVNEKLDKLTSDFNTGLRFTFDHKTIRRNGSV